MIVQGTIGESEMIFLKQDDGHFWLVAALQGVFTLTGVVVAKSEKSAPSRLALTICTVVVVDLLKNGLVFLMSEQFEWELPVATTLVILSVLLYVRSDRDYVELVKSERISMYEQQGGDGSSMVSKPSVQFGYQSDFEWALSEDSDDGDDEARKHLLAQEEDQSLSFIT